MGSSIFPDSRPPTSDSQREASLAQLEEEIISCRRCPRLVEWREKVAREKRAAYSSETYWGRPVPGFGDPRAEVVILGLAPAAHGANRTGRFFTGDRSGDFLFAALHRAGFANRPVSRHREDGLRLSGAWISAAVRCAPPQNRPTPSERDACLPYAARELELLEARVVVCLGAFAWDAAVRTFRLSPKPRFAHGAEVKVGGVTLLGCYHPSQQNTFTGVLTPARLEDVLMRARGLVVPNPRSHRIK
jgi:uracil-DNA glycosylase family 4